MADIALVSAATTNTGSSTTPSVSLPSGGAAGNLLLVIVNHNDGTLTVTDNNGATPLTVDLEADTIAADAGGGGTTILTRIMTGSEPSTLNFTQSGSNRWAIAAMIYSNVDSSIYDVAPVNTSNKNTSASTINSASVTTLTDGALAIGIGEIDDSTGRWNSGSPGGSWAEVALANAQEPLKIVSLAMPSHGASGDIALTTTFSTNIAALNQFALKPAAAPPATTLQDIIGIGIIPFPR